LQIGFDKLKTSLFANFLGKECFLVLCLDLGIGKYFGLNKALKKSSQIKMQIVSS
jgi:hypothetical protein